MIDAQISQQLAGLPLGGVRFFDELDSTNNEASRWIRQEAPDMALVLADHQTEGKGRLGRKWFAPPETALLFSLVLRDETVQSTDQKTEENLIITAMRMTALGALAVCDSLETQYRLYPQIKWPNDILLNGGKTAGILVETHWQGNYPPVVILGIGINIASGSVPSDETVRFPATCLEDALGAPVDRFVCLRVVLENLIAWRQTLVEPAFVKTWESKLAYRGEWVDVFEDTGTEMVNIQQGRLIGLDNLGRLRLQDDRGSEMFLINGELSLRAVQR